ncbi:hypothetical protein V6N13_125474 [Hibiscus sabdariffa]
MWAADGLRVFASNIPDSAWFTQLVQYACDGGGVGRYSPTSYGDCVFSSSVVCIELQHPVEIGADWLPSKAKPAKITEPLVDDWL